MIYVKWFLLLIINQITNIINYPLTPIVVLFASDNGWLPWWLWWFQTPDCNLDGATEPSWPKVRPYPNETNHYKRWVNRFSWLHRNKLYGFSEAVLSVKFDRVNDVFHRLGGDVRNVPSPGKSGTIKRWLYSGEGKLIAWQFYYIRQYKRWPNKCIRLNLGWKLAAWEDGKDRATFAFSPSPWMRFEP